MDWTNTTMTVVEYHNAFLRGEIEVNANYQRSDKVWPDAAKSFLIESLILGFPVPKFSLHQVTNVSTRTSRKEVVDGQQRSRAIWGFLDGKYPISKQSEIADAAGRYYENLSEEHQQAILDYALPFDLYTATSDAEVREAFRRINSFTVPLNAEEQRHALFQGEYKWFAYHLSKSLESTFLGIGMFTPKQIVRMADAKWIAEISDALANGISTTNKATLDRLYRLRDREFPERAKWDHRFKLALDIFYGWEELHKTTLTKPFMMYSLVLAIMHTSDPVDSLQKVVPISKGIDIDGHEAVATLSTLSAAFDDPETADDETFKPFVSASVKGTNVRASRETRFRWFCNALLGQLP